MKIKKLFFAVLKIARAYIQIAKLHSIALSQLTHLPHLFLCVSCPLPSSGEVDVVSLQDQILSPLFTCQGASYPVTSAPHAPAPARAGADLGITGVVQVRICS